MGKLTTFEILVDNLGGLVKVGETLRGQLLLELSADLEVNEVRMSFTGLSRIHWAEANKAAPMAEIQTTVVDPVTAEEIYCSELKKLFPAERSGTSRIRRLSRTSRLTKGTHTFNFEFFVPEFAPCSFSGIHGNVRYTLKAVVERPWKVDVNTRTITVESQLDLNDVPGARDRVEVSDYMKLTTLLFSSGECHATMRLAKKGFTLGEVIPVEFFIDNSSHHELYKVSLLLKMIITYKAEDRQCTCELPVGRSSLGKVPAGRTFAGLDRSLRVPLTSQPSGLPGCSLIDIMYQVQLKIRPAILSLKRLKLTATIIVGTKPLAVTSCYDSPPDYWSCCPPSYEDVMASSPRPTSTQPPSTQTPTTQTPSIETPTIHTSPTQTPSTQTPTPENPSSEVNPTSTANTNHEPILAVAEQISSPQRHSNDEPRLTVLRKSVTPGTEDEGVNRFMRPRANTGPIYPRPRGS